MASQINSAALLPLFWCHEEWVSLSVIKVLQSLYPLFHAYFLLISEKSSNFARLFQSSIFAFYKQLGLIF